MKILNYFKKLFCRPSELSNSDKMIYSLVPIKNLLGDCSDVLVVSENSGKIKGYLNDFTEIDLEMNLLNLDVDFTEVYEKVKVKIFDDLFRYNISMESATSALIMLQHGKNWNTGKSKRDWQFNINMLARALRSAGYSILRNGEKLIVLDKTNFVRI